MRNFSLPAYRQPARRRFFANFIRLKAVCAKLPSATFRKRSAFDKIGVKVWRKRHKNGDFAKIVALVLYRQPLLQSI